MPVALERRAQGAFGGQGKAVVGGLAVDEEAAALGGEVGHLAPAESRSSPLTNSSPTRNPAARRASAAATCAAMNALGVGHAAAIEELGVLAEGNEGRNGVHVRGEDQVGRLAGGAGVDIPARAGGGALGGLRHRRLFHGPAAAGEESARKSPTAPSW